jgi:hypothetical protein
MADQNINNMTVTWNSGGTTFAAIKMGVTDTASAAASKLLQLQVGGADKFTVDKAGNLVAAGNATISGTFTAAAISGTAGSFSGVVSASNGTAALPAYTFTDDTDSGMYWIGANTVGLAVNGAAKASYHVNGFTVSATQFDLVSPNGPDTGVSLSTAGAIVSYETSGINVQLGRNGDGVLLNAVRVGVSKGTISMDVSGIYFNSPSDKRLKRNWRHFDSGAIIDALESWEFEWIEDGSIWYGVLAQDAYKVFPQAITPPKKKGDPWYADYSKYVPVLLAEDKDLRRRMALAEARLASVEARLAAAGL